MAAKLPAGVIRFSALNGTTPALDKVSVATHAPGSLSPTPQFRVRRFQPDQPLARARREASVSAVLDHLNAEDVDLAVSLSLPPGVRVVQSNGGGIHRLRATESRSRLIWKLEADAPMTADLRLDLKTSDGSPIAHEPLRMLFLPPLEKSAPADIPEPVPAPTSMLVGAHHCPLWESDKPNMWLNVLQPLANMDGWEPCFRVHRAISATCVTRGKPWPRNRDMPATCQGLDGLWIVR